MRRGPIETIEIPKTNIVDNVMQSRQPITQQLLAEMKCFPRPPPKSLQKQERVKTPWDFFKSVFREYKPDTEVLLSNCFEFDWQCSKIDKVVKDENELAKVKAFMKGQYKGIREAYKFYSAVAPAGGVFSIGTNVYSDIMSNCHGAIDNKTLKLSDLDLDFVATNAGVKKGGARNPERQLVRYQLMEVFLRLAMTKYYKSKRTTLRVIRRSLQERTRRSEGDVREPHHAVRKAVRLYAQGLNS